MKTIKSYTDISQSKKLAKILPLESADIYWSTTLKTPVPYLATKLEYKMYKEGANLIPCWSLAALLNVLPEYNLQRTDWGNKTTEYKIVVYVDDNDNYASKNYNNPVDACVAMIEKLHELNLL